jgi:hypothetical protein
MTPTISISTLTIGDDAGGLPNVRVLLRMTVQEVSGSRMTAEGIAAALRTVLDRRGPA